MIHRVRSLVTVIALCVPSLAVADAVPRKKPDPVSTYLQQDKYTYCDVKVLSALWKQSVSDAKATIGIKIQAKSDATIDKMLVDARAAAKKNASLRCTFAEAGFSYEDAAALAKLWKKTESAAKVLAEDKILAGGEKSLRAMLNKPSTNPASEDPTATFLKQDKYTYCDVKLLTKLWKTSTDKAKATIGLKIQTKNETYLAAELTKARKNKSVVCTYDDVFTYADIEKIAKLWGVSVSQAKTKVGARLRAGDAASVRTDLGGGATNADSEDLAAFLKQNKYTYCDAAQIAAMWKTSVEEGKTFIGSKLRANSPQSIDNTLVRARKQPPVDGCKQPATPPAPPTKPVAPPPPAPKKM